MKNASELKIQLGRLKQDPLFETWSRLSLETQKSLKKELKRIDKEIFFKQVKTLKNPPSIKSDLKPYLEYDNSEDPVWGEFGQELLNDGKVGCILVAGGQGTRLKFSGPKGAYPVSLIKKKSLFQLFLEKVKYAGILAKKDLPVAILTSPLNADETKKFLKENEFFGLKKKQVDFFVQSELPFLNEKGELVLTPSGKIAFGPDGNGLALNEFVEAGLFKKWKESGVSLVNFVLIDNPLADPFDPALVGFHSLKRADVTIKGTLRKDPSEKVGVVAESEGKITVVEYSEGGAAVQGDKVVANLSLFCFSMDWMEKACIKAKKHMPLHASLKPMFPGGPDVWKFERYIFDILPFAKKIEVLMYPREKCFSPLKNDTGQDSLESVQKALFLQDQQIFKKITGNAPPNDAFELSQAFHYPTSRLLKKWVGKKVSDDSYIHA